MAFESAHQSIAPSTEPSRASSPQSRTRAEASAVADLFAVAGGVPDVAVDGVKGSWATCPSELANDDSSMVAPSPSTGSSRDRRAAGQAAPSQPLRGRSDMAPMQQEMERPGRRRSRDRSPSLGQSSAASFSGDSSIVDSEDSTGGRAKTKERAAVAAARQNARVPKPQARRPQTSSGLPDTESAIGNVAATYFNFGEQGKNTRGLEQHYIRWLRQNPGFILGGSEVSESYTVGLMAEEVEAQEPPPAVAGSTPPAVAGKKDRSKATEYKYMVEVMEGDKPCCVAVRTRMAESLHTVFECVYDHGLYKSGKDRYSHSKSRVIICKVVLRRQPCILPKDLVVMVLHFHYVTAKGDKGKKEERKTFLKWIVEKIKEYDVTILMTDANMALLMLFAAVRSSGQYVDTVAWWPWQLADGTRGMDSCCILLINQPGVHKMKYDLNLLEAGDLWANAPVLPGRVVKSCLNGCPGYGQLLTSYHTAGKEQLALEAFLTPSLLPGDAALVQLGRSRGRDKDERYLSVHNAMSYTKVDLQCRQMPLESDDFKYKGEWPTGGHFPLCFATKMNGRRSEAGYQKKRDKQSARKAESKGKGGCGRSDGKGTPVVAGCKGKGDYGPNKGKATPAVAGSTSHTDFFNSEGEGDTPIPHGTTCVPNAPRMHDNDRNWATLSEEHASGGSTYY